MISLLEDYIMYLRITFVYWKIAIMEFPNHYQKFWHVTYRFALHDLCEQKSLIIYGSCYGKLWYRLFSSNAIIP